MRPDEPNSRRHSPTETPEERRRARDDVEAFGLLLRRYEARVYRLVRQLIRREAEAAEVTQDVFYQALRSRERYDPERPFAPWLFRVAVNTCRNHRRLGARGEYPTELAPASSGMWAEPIEGSDVTAERHETARRLNRALATLDPDTRELLLLRHCEGLSYGELATIYRRPQSVLKMRVHRAIKKLRASADELLQ